MALIFFVHPHGMWRVIGIFLVVSGSVVSLSGSGSRVDRQHVHSSEELLVGCEQSLASLAKLLSVLLVDTSILLLLS